jgi:hypothetical protein
LLPAAVDPPAGLDCPVLEAGGGAAPAGAWELMLENCKPPLKM